MLERLTSLARGGRPVIDLADWRARHDEATRGLARPIERAIAGGASMDRLGYVFASGYRAALEVLCPELELPAALAATERGGAHPRAIEARLEGDRLHGEKAFVTLAGVAERLVVIARVGSRDDGRPRLVAALLGASAEGVRIEPTPPLPFAPEIPHARVCFEGARIERVLPGDGYEDVLKPFRTIEDLHVFAACLAHVFALASRGRAPPELGEEALAGVAAALELSRRDPRDPHTQLALAGLLALGRGLIARATPSADDEEAARFRRDLPLLDVASKARAARLAAARARLP